MSDELTFESLTAFWLFLATGICFFAFQALQAIEFDHALERTKNWDARQKAWCCESTPHFTSKGWSQAYCIKTSRRLWLQRFLSHPLRHAKKGCSRYQCDLGDLANQYRDKFDTVTPLIKDLDRSITTPGS